MSRTNKAVEFYTVTLNTSYESITNYTNATWYT